MAAGPDQLLQGWIETFSAEREMDLLPHLRRQDGQLGLHHPWGARHRPDWEARGLLIWPRGGQTVTLSHQLQCPARWQQRGNRGRARLALRWWAEAAELRCNGAVVHRGDLFDAACRWELPSSFWQGELLTLELELMSPRHDDGALLLARVEREPSQADDPDGMLLLAPLRQLLSGSDALLTEALLQVLHQGPNHPQAHEQLHEALRDLPRPAPLHLVAHAHLDLAWLWPVADTWQAAERTFHSVLQLMDTHPELRFGHSTPALYHWLQQHRPTLFAAISNAMAAGRWEALNGPWVETDCTLVGSASLLRQFLEGQHYSHQALPRDDHNLAWLPDSFGFSQGLPAVCQASGVAWFITHKLFWNADQPFPHRLFRWRHPSGEEVLALMSAPIGTDGDPIAMADYSRQWQQATGIEQGLWLPGVGDHGGGPSREMLDQLALWQDQPLSAPRRFSSVRRYLQELEPLAAQLPLWRDELYLELHRACPTSRPDQKRHNRSLERLLLEADLVEALAGRRPSGREEWRNLLFQQFHDILPGTSVPEVFEQAEAQWRRARRRSRSRRDAGLAALIPLRAGPSSSWWVGQLLPAPASQQLVRLPQPQPGLQWCSADGVLHHQRASTGGCWLQLPMPSHGVMLQRLSQQPMALPATRPSGAVQLRPCDGGGWWLQNNHLRARLGATGVLQLQGSQGEGWGDELLAEPLAWRRFADRGEFWDAWDLASDYREKPLDFSWQQEPEVIEDGPLCSQLRWRGACGGSAVQLSVRLQADRPWLELIISADWRQLHELWRCELNLASPGGFWASDAPGGVHERPNQPRTDRERSRWEVAAISWLCGGQATRALALLLDGPQGVSGHDGRLGVSLLRGATWPDPGADSGWQRLRLGLMPAPGGWWQADVPSQARAFRQPLWRHPAAEGEPFCQELLPWHDQRQQWLGFRADQDGNEALRCSLQNISPARSQWPQASGPWSLSSIDWNALRPQSS